MLVAIDGSTYAAKALDYAVGLAEKCSARINIVHVVPEINFLMSKLEASKSQYLKYINDGLEEVGRTILSESEKTVKISNINVAAILKHGDTADKIIETAQEVKADLIVVGQKGLGSGEKFPLGSIAYKVSQQAKCPVLIIK